MNDLFTSDNPSFSLPNSSRDVVVSLTSSEHLLHSDSDLQPSGSTVNELISAATAASTRKAYRGDVKDFFAFGGSIPTSPEYLAQYIASRSERHKTHTIARRIAGIGRAHVSLGYPDPTKSDLVRTVLRGLRRTKGSDQRRAKPILKDDLIAMLPMMTGVLGARDSALLLIGFAAALRRSELVALDVSDLAFVDKGIALTVRRSKVDQEGHGRIIGIPFARGRACPVRALKTWLAISGITSGAVFRAVSKDGRVSSGRLSDQSVNLVLKRRMEACGFESEYFSGHSLRAGLATSAAAVSVPLHRIMAQTGHRSVEMVSRYIREADIFHENAAGKVL